MKVRVLQSFGSSSGAHNEGDELDLPVAVALDHIRTGLVEAIVEVPIVMAAVEAPKMVKVRRSRPHTLERA